MVPLQMVRQPPGHGTSTAQFTEESKIPASSGSTSLVTRSTCALPTIPATESTAHPSLVCPLTSRLNVELMHQSSWSPWLTDRQLQCSRFSFTPGTTTRTWVQVVRVTWIRNSVYALSGLSKLQRVLAQATTSTRTEPWTFCTHRLSGGRLAIASHCNSLTLR
jgi:hypothetical protein